MKPTCLLLIVFHWVTSPVEAFPQSGDPLMVRHVPVPVTAGELYLRELTLPPGLFLWRTVKELEGLNTAQIRTLMHQMWIIRRRYNIPSASEVYINAWAERDLAGIVTDMLTISRWEDDDPWVGDYDIDIEYEMAQFWCRLAEQDWKKALTLLEKVNSDESGSQFWEGVSNFLKLPPERLPAFASAITGRQKEAGDLLHRVIWSCVRSHGAAATEKAAKKIKNKEQREEALMAQDDAKKRGAGNVPPATSPPEVGNEALRKLLRLDYHSKDRFDFPFTLLREVLKLTPAEALELAKQLPRDPQPPGFWLAWMLFMRVTDGDPAAARAVAAGLSTPGIDASGPLATVYALRSDMEPEAALEEFRAMESIENQREALSGYLTGKPAREVIVKQLGSPLTAFAYQIALPVDRWRTALFSAAAAGEGEGAWKAAKNLKELPNSASPGPSTGVIEAWALSDLPSLCRFAASAEGAAEIDEIADRFGNIMPFLPLAAQLDMNHPLPPEFMAKVPEMHWQFLAYEAREEGFRYLEKYGTGELMVDAVARFSRQAIRYEPLRALALLRRSFPTEDSSLLAEFVYYHGDEPKLLAEVAHTEEAWGTVGYEMANHFPDNVQSLLKTTPGTAAWRGAALRLKAVHPDRVGPLEKYLTESERYDLKQEISEQANRRVGEKAAKARGNKGRQP